MDIEHFLFGILGNACGLFLFLAPAMTFKRIIANQSTEMFSGIPYVMALLNCLLSACFVVVIVAISSISLYLALQKRKLIRTWYGLPFVSHDNILVTAINGTGAVIETIYIFIFILFAPKKEKAKILGLFTFVVAVFSAIVFVSLFALHGYPRDLFCGFAAAIFSIVMYGSPLSIMSLVIRTKSVEFMPFLLSLFVFLCGTSWFIFGLLGRDPFLAVPNGVGSGLGAMQLILYFIYRDNRGAPKKATTEEESMEKGTAKPHQEEQSKADANANETQGGHV